MPRSLIGTALRGFLVVAVAMSAAGPADAQRGGGRAGGAATPGPTGGARDTTRGFPIMDRATIQACGECHLRDSTGVMQRLSFERKTPEGWEMSVRRMVSLNNVSVDPATARAVVRYLSDHHGLAPAELKPGRFEVERRSIEYRYTADTRTETTCRACHSMGRVITQRRTRGEWELLVATHRSLYPDADFQAFRRGGPAQNDSGPIPHPMDVAINHLSRVFPLRTPEWTAWSATMRSPHLEGTWMLSGMEPGRGAFFGHMTITRGATDGEFITQANYRYADGGPAISRAGKSIVYTGFQWRGRSTAPSAAKDSSGLREVMLVEPGWEEMSGRWFTGGYEEIGMDVSLTKLGTNAVIAGVAPRALRVGTRGQDVTIFGANLSRSLAATAVDFGPGVTVERVIHATPDSVTLRVNVDSTAPIG
jgi:quinohemoprotein amine dehydrogenase